MFDAPQWFVHRSLDSVQCADVGEWIRSHQVTIQFIVQIQTSDDGADALAHSGRGLHDAAHHLAVETGAWCL